MWNWEIILFSYFVHIIFISFSHFWARNPGPGPKAAAGQARPGPRAAALGPRPGSRAPKCENNMKIIWKKYENDVICQFHIISTFLSYYFHIFITFLGSGPRSGPPKSYFCHIPGHIFFIPQTDLSVGVLTVLVKGPCLRCRSGRALCPLISVRRLRERCMSPSPLSYEIGTRGHFDSKTQWFW